MTENAWKWEQDGDGIVTITMDDPTGGANTMNEVFEASFKATLERLVAEKDSYTGVVITSAKKTFFAGADLNKVLTAKKEDAEEVTKNIDAVKAGFRVLETLGKPVVAAINGAALGGGYEIALATHHRVALDVKGSEIGLPEVTLGLLPGAGGVTRTVRMFGITNALMQVLVQGQRYKPAKAKEVGLVDDLASTPEELLAKAKAWVKANPEAAQPWDVKGYKIPGGTPSTPSFAMNLPAFPANLRKQIKGAPMPAPLAIMSAAVEGAQVDIDTATKIETRYLVNLWTGQVSSNMTKAFFFDLQNINKGGFRPEGYDKTVFKKVAVLGAGMMGAAIAYVCSLSGMEVILKDVSQENAERGKGYSKALCDKAVAKGKTTQEKADELLSRITPTGDPKDVAGADLIIEAVFESQELKHKVFQEVEDLVAPDALLGSNTSTLPITGLAEGVKRQPDFIGLHFFSPVDKMPLIEIIRGANTSDAALAKAIDLAQQIKKTPIVVNDSRGFFTSRVIGFFIDEAVEMVAEGVNPVSIEQAGQQAGYPAAPLQLLDELTLTLPRKIRNETKTAILAEGGTWDTRKSEAVIDDLVEKHDRKGKSTGAGFYEYADGKRTGLWPGIFENYTKGEEAQIPFKDIQERMLFAEALETVKCFDEGVLNSVAEANIGSIFGIGFPAWTGGVIQYINQYEGGLPGFVARSRELAKAYGHRFEPPVSLVKKAESGEIYE
ncbi:3-hydroxyacyl-CoA dehydrogenase [Pseudonocardiaceae bacterium YIM PH 21723]|nr:3-hydroxyacyl-CoA dehydrogenase [Pseudonocardiaceae bacterium YIM PH 21723]